MKKLLWSIAMALVCWSSGPSWSQGTGYSYDPMNDGTWIQYAVHSIQGFWHPEAMQLDVTWRSSPVAYNTLSFSSPNYCNILGGGPLYGITYNGSASLQDGGWVVSGKNYIGEAINENGNVQIPFIGKLTQSPDPGEQLNATSVVYESCQPDSQVIEYLPWTYQTIDKRPMWGNFADVVRTGLWEKNSQATNGQGQPLNGQDRVYNYVFQNGVGVVNFWYGYVQPDGTLYYNPYADPPWSDPKNGFEYYAISHN